ncbi:MFS transporter/fungal specific transcription factor domain-containing protein [Aspergillus stella-maris]|uniref:MFS transporter/fungal specific transcription factor domain-containing protein n=1 Tax=Aspergillus stella-maris TaxID=1810926 RepID=UPI003CCDFCD4
MLASSTPSKRPQACERCWKRKQKVGFACVEAKAECSPRQIPLESSEDSSGLSHAALPGYVASLKQRLLALEALSQRKRRRTVQEDAVEDATAIEEPGGSSGLDSSVQAAMGEIGFLSRSAMAEPRDGAGGFPRQLAMHEMLHAMLSLSGDSPAQARSSDDQESQWNFLAADPTQALKKETVSQFLSNFFDRIGMFYVQFDAKELEDQCDAFFADSGNRPSDALDLAQTYRNFSVFLATAIGIILSPQSVRLELLSHNLHSAAVKLLPKIVQSGSCNSLIHCLLLLVVYSMLSPSGGSTWHLLGLAMKRCVALGLHKEHQGNSPIPEVERTKRRHLFWSLYYLDRTVCTAMDRPFGIHDEDISVPFPESSSTSEDSAMFEVHLLTHARLITSIRDSEERCPIFHFKNICFWREVPRELLPLLEAHEGARNHIQQLSCRAMDQILPMCVGASYDNPFAKSQGMEVEQGIRDVCEQMIDRMYRDLDQPSSLISFTDGYDIFGAGVAILCTSSMPINEATVVNKCIALLTSLGERFSGIKVFRRMLLAMSDVGMGKGSEHTPTPATLTSSNKPTVYLIDTLHPDAVEHAKTLFNVVCPSDPEVENWRENASAVLIRGSYITADDITHAPNLIAIGKHGVGIDKIDQVACAKRGIKILNTPGANARDVAELVVSLTMSLARSIRSITTRQMTAPVPKETCTGLTLHKKTIGIIGMGNIGRTVAEIFNRGFDAELIAFDAFIPDDAWPHLAHKRAQSIQEVVAAADVLTLHIPLTDETRNMLSYKQLRQMKPDAILINAARGGIVNEDDLTRVLSEGHLWGAGLDCHEQEPPSFEMYGKLWKNLNVVSTPHIGAATNTAQRSMPSYTLDISLHTICNKQGLAILRSKAAICQILPTLRCTKHPSCNKASPFGSPSYRTHSVTVLLAVTRKIRPYGTSTTCNVPSGVTIGPSRKMSDGGAAEPPRHSALREQPKGVFNAYLFSVTWIFALAGVAKGFDEEDEYANTKGWIVSIATAGAVFGCVGSLPINDRVGRRWTLRIGTVVYIAGILGQGLCGGSLGGLYASRIVSGMGIGVTTIVPPVYISEIAPKAIRGLLTLQYAACQQLGVVLGFFINYGVTKRYAGTNTQWMLPTLLQLLPAALWGIGTFLCPESPRWLLSVGRREEAASSLSSLRHLPADHPVVAGELGGMDSQLLHEHESAGSASLWQLLKETLVPVENRRRFFLLFMATLFSQWSGANAITQYSPTIFGYLGIVGDEAKFLTTGIYGVVKFVSTLLFAMVIVDFVGRRRSLLTGICLQIVTLVFVGAYLGATKDMTADEIKASPNAERAGTAAIVAIYLHAVAWSIGWFSIPYLIGPEIFPTRIRSLNMSISMALHWAFYFGCSRAMPSLLAATHRWGAFLFFSIICVLGLIYVSLAMPDTTGRSLEALDRLFQRPWYTVHKIAYANKDDMQIESTSKADGKLGSEHLESA